MDETITQTTDNASTDAVEHPAEPLTTRAEHHGRGPTGAFPNPPAETTTLGVTHGVVERRTVGKQVDAAADKQVTDARAADKAVKAKTKGAS